MWSSVFHSGDGSITPEYDVSSINLSASAFWQCLRWCTGVVVVPVACCVHSNDNCRRRRWWHQRWRSAATVVKDSTRVRVEVRFRVSPWRERVKREERGNVLDMADNILCSIGWPMLPLLQQLLLLLLLWFLQSYCYGLRLRSAPHTVLIKPNAVHNQHTHTHTAATATATSMTIATALTWIRCVVHVQRLQDQRKRLL